MARHLATVHPVIDSTCECGAELRVAPRVARNASPSHPLNVDGVHASHDHGKSIIWAFTTYVLMLRARSIRDTSTHPPHAPN